MSKKTGNSKVQTWKNKLKRKLKRLQGSDYAERIAESAGVSAVYVRKWFRTELVQEKIEDAAFELLESREKELKKKLGKVL